jgi:ABC-type multidrug transport system fused ATPase/permease subunit
MKIIVLTLLLLTSYGCFRAPDFSVEQNRLRHEAQQAKEEKAMSEQKASDANKSLSELKQEKKDLINKAAKAESDAREFRAQADEKQKEITQARLERIQATCYWVAGIAIFLGLIAGGIAIFLPLVRKWAIMGALAAVAVAALAIFLSWLIPFLVWVGSVLAGGGLVSALIWWLKDHKTATQVVQAVEALKPELLKLDPPETPEKEKGKVYKSHFRQHVDSDVDKHVNKIRRRIGAAA